MSLPTNAIASQEGVTISTAISATNSLTAPSSNRTSHRDPLKAHDNSVECNQSGQLLSPLYNTLNWMVKRIPKTGQATILAVLLFLLLQLAGIYIFTRGFLLTRLAIEEKSQCGILPTGVNATTSVHSTGCWQPRSFKRAVVVIIDALRFDFAAFDRTRPRTEYYRNKLPVIDEAIRNRPGQAALFEFVADPPTTTLQRLKALTTGTLPTFVDAGSNFAGSAITEDNWLAQANSNGLRIWQIGDDTWGSIYPENVLNKTNPYPSFNVRDLHTVDNGILSHLPEAFGDKRDEWDILITHYLGVDHCGHLYSASHPAMEDKLLQMNNMLEKLIQQLDNDTVLLVFGDHGMDTKGDHGGDSEIEVQAALFMYGGREFMPKDRRHLNKVLNRLAEYEPDDPSMRAFINRSDVGFHRTVPQIDLVPTISFLLGIPIPYSNLGMVIPELFLAAMNDYDGQHHHLPLDEHINSSGTRLASATRLNAQQVFRYMEKYTSRQPSGEMAEGLKLFRKKFVEAEDMYERYIANNHHSTFSTNESKSNEMDDAQAYEVFLAYAHFLRASLSFCRRIWAQFDTVLMNTGIAILLAICLCMWRITRRTTPLSRVTVISWYKGALAGVVITILAQRIRLALVICNMLGMHTLQQLDQTLVAMVTGFLISFLVNSYREPIVFDYTTTTESVDVSTKSIWYRVTTLLPSFDEGFGWLILVGAQCMMFASNSLTVFEDRIDLALLQTYGIVSIIRAIARYRICCIHNKHNVNDQRQLLRTTWRRWVISASLFMLLTRLSGGTTICREEQGKDCVPNFYTGSGAWASDATLVQLVASAIITPWLIRRALMNTQSFHGVARLWIDWGLRLALLLSAGYWILDQSHSTPIATHGSDTPNVVVAEHNGLYGDASTSDSGEEGMMHILKRTTARFGYGTSLIIGLIGWRSNPLCLAIGKPSQSTNDHDNNHNNNNNTTSTRAILGIDNAYGAPYLVLLTVMYAALSQTQQPSGGLSFAIGICHLITTIELFAAQSTVQRMTQPRSPPASSLGQAVILAIMAQHYYFATGHQATLASIQWRTSFIGLKDINWIVSPLLIIVNTFGSHILFSMAIPLLVLWRLSARKSIGNPASEQVLLQQQYDQASSSVYSSSRIWSRICRIAFAWSLVWTISAVAICMWCVNFRRHLMVWKVWAPRFMLGTVATLINQLVLVVVTLWFGVARTVDAVDNALNRPLEDEFDNDDNKET
ncbi:hypothetical protein BDF22DRAFT_774875 [Syncephalis plumigaleata]|nr:hypothetical protein BDF22DRAFT_774875 [Syncephalis plumigaleata]